ncbi:MAG: triple tyrosine motif-containing protein [Thermoanaerobaculia bacterium]
MQSLLEDAKGRVWLGATVRVDPEAWTFDEFGPADGCSFRNFYFASRSKKRDGELLFGSPEGLMVVRPERIVPWKFEPDVVATAVSVGGIDRRGASTVNRVEIEPGRRSLRVEFAALDLTAPQRNRYRYRLEGYDDAWVTTDASQRSITYANRPPRSYTLVVQGTNRAGRWSPRLLRIDVVVHPAFYETAWFRLVAAACLLALTYGGYRLRVRQIEARNRRLQRLVDERTAELAEKNRQLEGAYEKIEEASLTDPLTGLHNRRYLEQTITSCAAEGKSSSSSFASWRARKRRRSRRSSARRWSCSNSRFLRGARSAAAARSASPPSRASRRSRARSAGTTSSSSPTRRSTE